MSNEIVIASTGAVGIGRILSEICSVFVAQQQKSFALTLGWGCQAEQDELWIPVEVPVEALESVVDEKVRLGVFRFGDSDLYLSGQTFEFKICHEGDLHFKSDSQDLINAVRASWMTLGHLVCTTDPAAMDVN